jgi:hypothetical protein
MNTIFNYVNLNVRNYLGDRGIDTRIILKRILRNI